MVSANQQTIAPEVYESINNLIYQYRFFPTDSLEIRRLFASVQKLMDVDPAKANLAKSMLYWLIGDFDQAKKLVGVSNNGLPLDNKDLHLSNSATTLANANFYTESQHYYNLIKNVSLVDPWVLVNAGLNCLAFEKMKGLTMDASKLGIKLDEAKTDISLRASKILNEAQLTDNDIAKYADVFGEVLRENHVMNADLHPTITIGDDQSDWYPHTIFIVFKVRTDALTAAQLYKSSLKRSFEKFGTFPDALHISIESI